MTADPRAKANLLVTAQFTLLAGQLFLRPRNDWSTAGGVRVVGGAAITAGSVIAAIAASNLGAGLTASPLPNSAAQLRTGGMYRWVRHPIYCGLLLVSAGRTLTAGDRRQLGLTVSLMALLNYKAAFEERALRQRFPGYGRYAATTPRFLPVPRRRRPRSERDTSGVRGWTGPDQSAEPPRASQPERDPAAHRPIRGGHAGQRDRDDQTRTDTAGDWTGSALIIFSTQLCAARRFKQRRDRGVVHFVFRFRRPWLKPL